MFALYTANIATRLGLSVLFQFLFQAVADQDDLSKQYLLAFASAVLLFIDSTIMHNSFYEGPIISACLKSCLVSLMFKKICRLTQYTANHE